MSLDKHFDALAAMEAGKVYAMRDGWHRAETTRELMAMFDCPYVDGSITLSAERAASIVGRSRVKAMRVIYPIMTRALLAAAMLADEVATGRMCERRLLYSVLRGISYAAIKYRDKGQILTRYVANVYRAFLKSEAAVAADERGRKPPDAIGAIDIETNALTLKHEVIGGTHYVYDNPKQPPRVEGIDSAGDRVYYTNKQTGAVVDLPAAETYALTVGRFTADGGEAAETFFFSSVFDGIIAFIYRYECVWAHNAGFDFNGIASYLAMSPRCNLFTDAGEIEAGKRRKRNLLLNGKHSTAAECDIIITGAFGDKFYSATFAVYPAGSVVKGKLEGAKYLRQWHIAEGAKRLAKCQLRDTMKILSGSLLNISNELGCAASKHGISNDIKHSYDYNKVYRSMGDFSDNDLRYMSEDIYRLYYLIDFIYTSNMDKLTAKGNSVAHASWQIMRSALRDGGVAENDDAPFVPFASMSCDMAARFIGSYLNRDLEFYFPSASFIPDADAYDVLHSCNSGGLVSITDSMADERPISSGDYYVADADINSAYPHIMASYALPVGKPDTAAGYGAHSRYLVSKGRRAYVMRAMVRFCLRPDVPPIVSNKTTADYKGITVRLRSFEGEITLTSAEVAYLEEGGDFEVLNVSKFYLYHVKSGVFDFLAEMFENRKLDKLEGRAAMAYLKKIIMNALYGALCQRVFDVDSSLVFDERGVAKKHSHKSPRPSAAAHLTAGAFITAHTRIMLASAIIKLESQPGVRAVYTDTDSIMFKIPLKLADARPCDALAAAKRICRSAGIQTGDELGQFDIEAVMGELEVLRPKTYQCMLYKQKSDIWRSGVAKTACGLAVSDFARWVVRDDGTFIKGVMSKMKRGVGGKVMNGAMEMGSVSGAAYDVVGRMHQLVRWGRLNEARDFAVKNYQQELLDIMFDTC